MVGRLRQDECLPKQTALNLVFLLRLGGLCVHEHLSWLLLISPCVSGVSVRVSVSESANSPGISVHSAGVELNPCEEGG